MDYVWLVLSLVGFWVLIPIIASFLGIACPACFYLLSFIITTYSVYAGIGASVACILNLLVGYGVIPVFGIHKKFKSKGMLSSWSFLAGFVIAMINNYFVHFSLSSNLVVFIITIGAIFVTFIYIYRHSKKHQKFNDKVENYRQSVVKLKVVEKYPEAHKWALYLYFNNGHEDWNYAVPSSENAMDPKHNDLTYVFDTKDDAMSYAKDFFNKAQIEA